MLPMMDSFELSDNHFDLMPKVPKSLTHRVQIRKETQKFLEKHLFTPIANICIHYLYRPTFKNMSCFETCGILRVPFIGDVLSQYAIKCRSHNARCPFYPCQCLYCGSSINHYHFWMENESAYHSYLRELKTDQPFIKHNRCYMLILALKTTRAYKNINHLYAITIVIMTFTMRHLIMRIIKK